MKKVITILLAITIVILAFVGCSKVTTSDTDEQTTVQTDTKEELLAEAVEASVYDIQNDSVENIVNAKEKYCNKTLKIEGMVLDLKEDHIVLGTASSEYAIDAFLPTEDISSIETLQKITIVGKTSDEMIEAAITDGAVAISLKNYQMKTAYLLQDRYDFEAVVESQFIGEDCDYFVWVGKSEKTSALRFADGTETPSLSQGDTIKFNSKVKYSGDTWTYYDAEIIE